MNVGRIFCKLAKIAAVVVAVLPSLVQAFIPSVSDPVGGWKTPAPVVDASSGETVAEYDPYGVLLGVKHSRVSCERTGGAQSLAPAFGGKGLPPSKSPFRFSSKYYDPETQLLYFGYRYYNPASTKWLTVDPLQERGGLNFTAYCNSDPVNRVDPLGKSILSLLLGFGRDTEEAKAFDDYLYDDYWGGDFSRRGVDAINAELKMAVGAVEALAGAKLTVFSSGLAAAGGYALVADGSSWMCGGAGDYLNIFRDDDLPDYDVVGVGFRQMAGPTWGPIARNSATMGVSMGSPILAQQQMNAAMTAEAQAIAHVPAYGSRIDTQARPVAVAPNTTQARFLEYKTLRSQGCNASEAHGLMKQFDAGANPGGDFLFHFADEGKATFSLANGIPRTDYGFGVWRGVYTGTTPTPNVFLKNTTPLGWGVPGKDVRMPIQVTPEMDVARPLFGFPLKTRIIRTEGNLRLSP